MYNLTILSFVPNQSERRLNLNVHPSRESCSLMKLSASYLIYLIPGRAPAVCALSREQRRSANLHVRQPTFHSPLALYAHSKHQHSLSVYLYIYKYVRVRRSLPVDGWRVLCKFTLLWAEKIKLAPSECVWVSSLVLVDEKSLHLWFVIYVGGAACAHRRQEFLIKSPTVTNRVAAVQHFCLFYDFTQAAGER